MTGKQPPHFLRNLDNFPPGAFYSTPPTISHKRVLKLNCRPLASTSYKTFLKKLKRGLELVSLPHFLHDY